MRSWLMTSRGLLSAAALVGAGAFTALHAAEVPEDTYLRYHRAIVAAEQCAHQKFGTPEQSRFATYIDGKLGTDLSAGRKLTLIEQAKTEVGDLVEKKGCGDPDVADLLALYDAELAPLLP
jgi:hypothetical protein